MKYKYNLASDITIDQIFMSLQAIKKIQVYEYMHKSGMKQQTLLGPRSCDLPDVCIIAMRKFLNWLRGPVESRARQQRLNLPLFPQRT